MERRLEGACQSWQGSHGPAITFASLSLSLSLLCSLLFFWALVLSRYLSASLNRTANTVIFISALSLFLYITVLPCYPPRDACFRLSLSVLHIYIYASSFASCRVFFFSLLFSKNKNQAAIHASFLVVQFAPTFSALQYHRCTCLVTHSSSYHFTRHLR